MATGLDLFLIYKMAASVPTSFLSAFLLCAINGKPKAFFSATLHEEDLSKAPGSGFLKALFYVSMLMYLIPGAILFFNFLTGA